MLLGETIWDLLTLVHFRAPYVTVGIYFIAEQSDCRTYHSRRLWSMLFFCITSTSVHTGVITEGGQTLE